MPKWKAVGPPVDALDLETVAVNPISPIASGGPDSRSGQRVTADIAGGAPLAASPLVSVIVPTYNRVRQTKELLHSLELQRWRPLEVIIVDDGSTELIPNDIGACAKDHTGIEIHVLRQPNRGPAAARNLGFAASSGDLIYFLDSDDAVEPDGICRMVHAIQLFDAPYCIGQVRCVGIDGRPVGMNEGHYASVDHESILRSRWAVHGALYRRWAFEAAGGFNEGLRRGEDREMRWRVVASNKPGVAVEGIVAEYRRHDEGQATGPRTHAQAGRSTLESLEAFCAWAEMTDCLRPPVVREAVWLLASGAIRMGAAGDREGQRRAVRLALKLNQPRRGLGHLLIGVARTESLLACRGLELISRVARLALHVRRGRLLRRELLLDTRTTLAGAFR